MNKKENQYEIRARQYLQTLQYTKLEYEPLGNVTPDFLIDKKVAVEVRRLNWNYIKDERLVGLESFKISTINTIKKSNSPLVINELQKNIQLVIDEKNKKIEQNYGLYYEWWLILVDYIAYGMESKDFEELKKIEIDKKKFTKIIILSPQGNFKAFKL